MAVLKVAKLGNPILRQVARQADLKELADPKGELQKFIDDMIDTMRQKGGGRPGRSAGQSFHTSRGAGG